MYYHYPLFVEKNGTEKLSILSEITQLSSGSVLSAAKLPDTGGLTFLGNYFRLNKGFEGWEIMRNTKEYRAIGNINLLPP